MGEIPIHQRLFVTHGSEKPIGTSEGESTVVGTARENFAFGMRVRTRPLIPTLNGQILAARRDLRRNFISNI
jgi:hypothetical protein